MNSKSAQTAQAREAEFEQQWQEAKRCDSKRPPCPQPRPEPPPIICERDSDEINIYVNTDQSNHERSGIWSWLPWLLLGLTSLLLLGNMFMMFASAQSVNNQTKEVTNTVNRSREVVRVERSEPDATCYSCPPGRW